MISIVDFGMGNIFSVANAFRYWKESVEIISTPKEVENARKLVLPGVGSFSEAMLLLKKKDLISSLHSAVIVNKTPILGICLGMQIMAFEGNENGLSKGLGWIDGKVIPLSEGIPLFSRSIPHIGFNLVIDAQHHTQKDYYFCHSYKLDSSSAEVSFGYSEYGCRFIASLQKGNIWGTQFHPEKSQSNGLLFLKKFIDLEMQSA
jgi:imidazole glycerol-phosphate synthase subunit HisH